MRVRVLISMFALSLAQPASYRPIPFPLVDEAETDPDLLRFRRTLLDIAKRRALEELVAVASETTSISREATATRIRRDFTEVVTPPWREFAKVLSLGGAFTTTRGAVRGRQEFCAPYVYSAFPEALPVWIGGEQLPWVVTRTDTPVYARTSTSSRVVATLGPAIVEKLDSLDPGVVKSGDEGWVLVAVTHTRRGYVLGSAARSPQDWHVCVAKEASGWRISEFTRDRFVMSIAVKR